MAEAEEAAPVQYGLTTMGRRRGRDAAQQNGGGQEPETGANGNKEGENPLAAGNTLVKISKLSPKHFLSWRAGHHALGLATTSEKADNVPNQQKKAFGETTTHHRQQKQTPLLV